MPIIACVGSHTHTHNVSPARQYSSLPDLPASLPLAFCYYVMTEAIADRKYSYTLYSHLEDKFWHVEIWELAGDTGVNVTHVLTHTPLQTQCTLHKA